MKINKIQKLADEVQKELVDASGVLPVIRVNYFPSGLVFIAEWCFAPMTTQKVTATHVVLRKDFIGLSKKKLRKRLVGAFGSVRFIS